MYSPSPLLLMYLVTSLPVVVPDVTIKKPSAHSSKPNIVIILADDLGIGDIGCYGNTTLQTPHIDSLARDGAKMTHVLAAASICTPSRAAIMTGRYPIRSGMSGFQNRVAFMFTGSAGGLPLSEVTFPELLKEAGYTNAIIGKWHLGLHRDWMGDNQHNPLKQGFDYWFGIPLSNIKDFDEEEPTLLELALPKSALYVNLVTLAGTLAAAFLWRMKIIGPSCCFFISLCFLLIPRYLMFLGANMKLLNSMLYRNYDLIEQPMRFEGLTRRLVAEGVEFLEAQQEDKEPFLLFMSLLQVRTALHAGPEFQGTSQHGAYGDEVQEMDWSVGQILEALDRLGMRDDTLVMFTSDHGGHVEEHGRRGDRQGGHNSVYSGGKGQGGMDGGLRVPTLIRWPGQVRTGMELDVPLSLMDILPTMADAAGVAPPSDRVVDGVSLLPLLTGETARVIGRDYLIHYCSDSIHAVRFNPDKDGVVWKVRFATPKWKPGTEGCGYFCFCSEDDNTFHKTPLVFDMTSNPHEDHPLAADDPRAQRLVRAAHDVIAHHTKSLGNVDNQMTWRKILFRPWLMPCCNFPHCSCKDTVN